MEGEEGKEVRRKVMKLGEMAHKALEEGGSSQSSLDSLLHEACKLHQKLTEPEWKERNDMIGNKTRRKTEDS